jgi:diaminopimelate epimerase
MKGIAGPKLSFETTAGIIHAEIRSRTGVLLQLSPPKDVRVNFSISVDNRDISVSSINTGVPHVAVPVADIENVAVKELGNKIRFHPEFQPAGTNVNFVHAIDPTHLSIRTYERGVEDETLACGTGAVASALLAAAGGKAQSPVDVQTRGGEVLTIHFRQEGKESFSQAFLEGDTCLVFEGTLGEDVWEKYRNATA